MDGCTGKQLLIVYQTEYNLRIVFVSTVFALLICQNLAKFKDLITINQLFRFKF